MTTVMGGALLVNCMNMCINMHTVYQEYSLPIWKLSHFTKSVLDVLPTKGAIIFFRMGGGLMKKLGGSQNFFMRNKGVKKNQEIIVWLQILMKVLFNEIAPKMRSFRATRIGVACFFNIVAPDGGS